MTEQTISTDYDAIRDMTPASAIQHAIFGLCGKRADWAERDDPSGVLRWIEAQLANLERAQRELEELREIKKALAILKSSVL